MDSLVKMDSIVDESDTTETVAKTNYYHSVRREIAPLLPKSPARTLEVGAGPGGPLNWLKTAYPYAQTTAIQPRINWSVAK